MTPSVGMALLAAVLFGVSTPIAKGLLTSARPQTLAGLLYLGSGLGLLVVWLWRRARESRSESPLSRADLPWLVAAIGAGGVAAPVLLMFGLQRTAASTSSLLLNLEGVFTASIAWLAFHENADRRIVAGMLALLAGTVRRRRGLPTDLARSGHLPPDDGFGPDGRGTDPPPDRAARACACP